MSTDISEYETDVQLVGAVTLGWSTAQSAVHALFVTLSGLGLERANAIFFALRQDRAQRDITFALAKATLIKHPDYLERASSLLNQLDKLSSERNAATHSLWFISKEQKSALVINQYAKPHGKLDLADHRQQFLHLAKNLNEVASGLVSLLVDLSEHFPWPDKNPQQTFPRTAND